MKDYFVKNFDHPMKHIKMSLRSEKPLWQYIKQAIQDIEIINILGLNKVSDNEEENKNMPFIHCINWKWNPHPRASEIQDRRRETGDKLSTKYIENTRVGILTFDAYCGARDKNKNLETKVIPNKIYVPIEDDQGRFLYGGLLYTKYQLVDKFIYPTKGGFKNGHIIKSLLPIDIHKFEKTEVDVNGEIVTGDMCEVKIFNAMEPILLCFMHIKFPLGYLSCFPVLQFSDRVDPDAFDKYYYFKPLEDKDIYIKAYRKGVEKFSYIRSILIMACDIIRKYKPENLDQVNDEKWWVYWLSYNESAVEHRGACHEMHVARMLDTITAEILPIPQCDRRTMMSLLRYSLMSQFDHINIFDFKNKRLRLNEAISTIITAEVSAKLKKMFKFGAHISMNDMEQQVRFNSKALIKKIHNTGGIVESIDFANDLDYYQLLRFTKSGPNALGNSDKHKINITHKQLHPSQMGVIDMYYSSKDVGQNGMLTPYEDLSHFNDADPNENPNIEYDLYKFIEQEFPAPRLRFNANNVAEFKEKLDNLVFHTYINLDYHPFEIESDPLAYRNLENGEN